MDSLEYVKDMISHLGDLRDQISEANSDLVSLEEKKRTFFYNLRKEYDKKSIHEPQEHKSVRIPRKGEAIPVFPGLINVQERYWHKIYSTTSIDEFASLCKELQTENKNTILALGKKYIEDYLLEVDALNQKILSLSKEVDTTEKKLTEIWNLCESVLKIHKKEVDDLQEKLNSIYASKDNFKWHPDDFNYDPYT